MPMLIKNVSNKPIWIINIDKRRIELKPWEVAQVSDVVGRGYLNNYWHKFKLYESIESQKVRAKAKEAKAPVEEVLTEEEALEETAIEEEVVAENEEAPVEEQPAEKKKKRRVVRRKK